MEKSNELNKFLSYIHMGNSIYRIYLKEAEDLEDKQLIKQIKMIQKNFKKHETIITEFINEYDEKATKSITASGLMGIYMEKMKTFENSFSICKAAIKSTNMGMLSTIKFLKENEHLSKEIKDVIKDIIEDYQFIQEQLVNFILTNCIKN